MKQCLYGFLCGLGFLLAGPAGAQDVLTQHNDLGRTGWNPKETVLNVNNVNQNTFGLAYNYTTDDKIVAQPLVLRNVNIPAVGNKNIVFVATQGNSIYAFDADVNAPAYWQVNYSGKLPGGATCGNCRPPNSTEMHPSLCGGYYPDFNGNMGIVSTPVIDPATNTMYFVAKIVNPNEPGYDNHTFTSGIKDEYTYTTNCFHQYLHAIDITTGQDRANSPVEITATAPGTGDGAVGGIITFDPRRQFSRAGLVLNNGKLYIAFAAHCDFNPCHGWVLRYDAATLTQDVLPYNTTPNDGRGGIWMTGTAPAVDAAGNLYFTTGNSLNEDHPNQPLEHNIYNSDPNDPANRGESIVKLKPDLTLSDWFTPFNYLELNDADKDFGTQVLLLPGTGLAMTGCKDDSIYVFNQTNLTHFDPVKNNTTQRVFVQMAATMHSTFSYFGGPTPYVYQYSENSPLKAYPYSGAGLGTAIINSSILGPVGGTGGFLSVSSNAADPTTGIVWAYQAVNGCNANGSDCRGILHAVNANDITTELWNSDIATSDQISLFNKFSCPTIALGKVFVAANSNLLKVYGIKPNTTCVNLVSQNKPITAFSTQAGFPATNGNDGNLSTFWTAQNHDVDSLTIDLGGIYDICKLDITWAANGYGGDFDLLVSNNKIGWTVVSSIRGNTAAYTEFNGTASGRYVCMAGINRGVAGNPYSIAEFQAFGSPGTVTCSTPTGLTASSGSTIFPGTNPAASADNNPPSIEVGTRFQSLTAGFIKGIRFFKSVNNPVDPGTHTAELYSNTGALLGSAPFVNETPSGWQEALFTAPVAIAANTTYVAAYYSPNGYYSGTNSYFTAPVVNGNLTALKDGTDGANGVYLTGHGFPVSTYQSSNYWVEPVFSTSNSAVSESLSWNVVPSAVQYIINYRPNLSSSSVTRTSTANSIDIGALNCGTLYFYTVQADCGGGLLSTVSTGSFTTADCPATTCDILPTRYYNVDLGDVGIAGNTCFTNATGVFKLTASGNIGGIADAFQYAYTSNDIADYDVVGRIMQNNPANSSSKTGIMVRDSLTNTSRFAYLAYVNNGFIFEYRDVPGAPATTVSIPGTYSIPYWMKISKAGTSYSAYLSTDGVSWVKVVNAIDLNFGTDATNAPHYGMAETSSDNNNVSNGSIDNFSVTGSTGLPINLLSFTAKNVNNDHVLINWSTSMEHLVDHFEVQRSLNNNSGFVSFDTVKAVGESSIPQYYSAIDNHPYSGTNYYRLKEVDSDNTFYYSPVIAVKFDQPDTMEVYPNPAEQYTNVTLLRETIDDVQLYDVTGKLLQTIHPEAGQSSIVLSTTILAKGIYVIRVKTSGGNIYRQKLYKL